MYAQRLLKENRNFKHRQIQQELGIGSASVNNILHKHLQVRKLRRRWIPHLLAQEEKKTRVDCCKVYAKKV